MHGFRISGCDISPLFEICKSCARYETEALTAVDVNAGRAAFINDSDNESVAVRVNVAAAEEMALQLRLRDIGGLVMIDYIDMNSREHRKEVEAAFLKAAKRDRAQVTFLPISPLGVMEVARERRGSP